MSYMKLVSHYTLHIPGGMSVGNLELTTDLGNGNTVTVPLPFIALGSDIGISPVIEPDGDAALRIDLTRWSPVRYDSDFTARFPFSISDQATAAKVARAFDADPAITWHSTVTEIRTWLDTWLAVAGGEVR
jgi:hypothetical protein